MSPGASSAPHLWVLVILTSTCGYQVVSVPLVPGTALGRWSRFHRQTLSF